jgi:hypothetical protein
MSRIQNLLFVAILMSSALMSSATAFAADPSEKPGPSAGAVTSGANPGVASGVSREPQGGLSSPPAGDPTVTENFNKLPAPGEKIPSPSEVNKGKPPAAPQ